MTEIVGVVAAATQLAATCLSLIEFTKKIKGGSSSLRDYEKQLQEIRILSESISQNPLLQTPEVEAHTLSILTLVNENDLTPLIKKRRFLRTFAFFYKEQDISEAFTSLERRKTSLSLTIHNLEAEAIHQIRSEVNAMAKPEHSDGDSSYGSQCDPLDNESSSSSSIGDGDADDLGPDIEINGQPLSAGLDTSTGTSYAHEPPKIPRMTAERAREIENIVEPIQQNRPGSNAYINNNSHDGANQNIGRVVEIGEGSEAPEGHKADRPPDTYLGCCAAKGSVQRLGDKEQFATFADMAAYGSQKTIIADCQALPGDNAKGGIQQCGPTTRVGTASDQ